MGLGRNAASSTGIFLGGSALCLCTTTGNGRGVSICAVVFRFLDFSTLVVFEMLAELCFETPESEDMLADCLFLLALTEGDGVSFVDEDFRLADEDLMACALLMLKA